MGAARMKKGVDAMLLRIARREIDRSLFCGYGIIYEAAV
jgi:hypothetical protein